MIKKAILDVLKMIKGFEVRDIAQKDKMIVEHEGKKYLVHFTEIKPKNELSLTEKEKLVWDKLSKDKKMELTRIKRDIHDCIKEFERDLPF